MTRRTIYARHLPATSMTRAFRTLIYRIKWNPVTWRAISARPSAWDRLLGTYTVRPIVERLRKTLLGCGAGVFVSLGGGRVCATMPVCDVQRTCHVRLLMLRLLRMCVEGAQVG